MTKLEVYTMSPENFFKYIKGFHLHSSSHKQNIHVVMQMTSRFYKSKIKFRNDFGVSNVLIVMFMFIQCASQPYETLLCITKDGQVLNYRQIKTKIEMRLQEQNVDMFVFCSKSNTYRKYCKYNANYDYMI